MNVIVTNGMNVQQTDCGRDVAIPTIWFSMRHRNNAITLKNQVATKIQFAIQVLQVFLQQQLQ